MKRLTNEEAVEKAETYKPIVRTKLKELYDKFESFDWGHNTDFEINTVTLKVSINIEGVDVVVFKQKIDSPYLYYKKEFIEGVSPDRLAIWIALAEQHVFNFLMHGIY